MIPHGMIVDRINRLAQFIYDDYMKQGKTPHILGAQRHFPALTRAKLPRRTASTRPQLC